MSDKFQNRYRIASTRLQNWDYGSNALYFVTICTANREHFFGEIVDGKMLLSEMGNIAEQEWLKTPEIRPDMNLKLGEFIVMPNHFHSIIIIGENEYNSQRTDERIENRTDEHIKNRTDERMINRTDERMINRRDAMHRVSTTPIESTTPTPPNETNNKFGVQSKNLASIIRGFKSSVTVYARKIHVDFGWQPLYYDHIIRNGESFQRISNYIKNNPSNWMNDKFYKI